MMFKLNGNENITQQKWGRFLWGRTLFVLSLGKSFVLLSAQKGCTNYCISWERKHVCEQQSATYHLFSAPVITCSHCSTAARKIHFTGLETCSHGTSVIHRSTAINVIDWCLTTNQIVPYSQEHIDQEQCIKTKTSRSNEDQERGRTRTRQNPDRFMIRGRVQS